MSDFTDGETEAGRAAASQPRWDRAAQSPQSSYDPPSAPRYFQALQIHPSMVTLPASLN